MTAHTLKRQHPQLSKLVAQIVHAKHRAAAVRETVEVRALLAELIRRGRDPRELMNSLLTSGQTGGDMVTRQSPGFGDRMALAGSQPPGLGSGS